MSSATDQTGRRQIQLSRNFSRVFLAQKISIRLALRRLLFAGNLPPPSPSAPSSVESDPESDEEDRWGAQINLFRRLHSGGAAVNNINLNIIFVAVGVRLRALNIHSNTGRRSRRSFQPFRQRGNGRDRVHGLRNILPNILRHPAGPKRRRRKPLISAATTLRRFPAPTAFCFFFSAAVVAPAPPAFAAAFASSAAPVSPTLHEALFRQPEEGLPSQNS